MDEPLSVYFVKIIIDDIGILAHLNGFDVRLRIVSDFIDFTSFARRDEDVGKIIAQAVHAQPLDRKHLRCALQVFRIRPIAYRFVVDNFFHAS